MKLFWVLLFIGFSAQAQRIERNEIDKFTKERVKQTSWFKLANKFSSVIEGRINITGDDTLLEVKIVDTRSYHFNEGDVTYLLLDNNETIKLYALAFEMPEAVVGQVGPAWHGGMSFRLSADTIKRLQRHKVVGIRITEVDYTVKEKNAAKLQVALGLVF